MDKTKEKSNKVKILFFIFDLGGGGAEKVLVNLVNNLNPDKYDITIRTIFGGGVNAQYLKPHIHYSSFFKRKPFRGFSKLQKLFSPAFLYKKIIGKEKYDVEIAYLQHSPTRILSGGKSSSRKYAWVHIDGLSYNSYRSLKEFKTIYHNLDGTAFVSKFAHERFFQDFGFDPKGKFIPNVNETEKIKSLASETIEDNIISNDQINLCSVGRFTMQKGYDRLIPILGELKKKGISNWHFYLLGTGEMQKKYEELIQQWDIQDKFTFLGYQSNPYKYISKMDLFVCSSREEGYSTAVTESIVLGIPVLTTDCSGMDEILEDSGAGVIVPNNDEALYKGLKDLLTHPQKINEMKIAAEKRSSYFSTEKAIEEFEKFIGTI